MAGKENKTTLLAISGPSCSGKTTVARLMCKVFENSFMLHEDDFYKTDQDIPYKDGVQDWDCLESLDLKALEDALHFVHNEGTLPPGFTSKEDQNEYSNVSLKDPSKVEKWRGEVKKRLGDKAPRVCIVDGFLLYSEGMKRVRDLLDMKFFLAIGYKTMKERREGRTGYVTIEGFWEDPPGYIDQIVWPHYVEDHAYLFKDGDVHKDYDFAKCEAVGIHPAPSSAGHDLDAALDWICQETITELEASPK